MPTNPIKDPKWPEEGFYFYYEREPEDSLTKGTVQVVGVGRNKLTDRLEAECVPLEERPGVNPKERIHIPLREFLGKARKHGELVPRYVLVADEVVIARLEYLLNGVFKKAVSR